MPRGFNSLRLDLPHASSEKLAGAVHYVIATTPPQRLGATKLNKVLWAADVSHFRRSGVSVTGGTAYMRLQFGPVPIGIVEALRFLEKAGRIAIKETPTASGTRKELWSKVDPDVSIFTAQEIASLVHGIHAVYKLSAAAASELTHDDLWEETPMKRRIPIAAAAVSIRTPSTKARRWAESMMRSKSFGNEACEAP